MVHDPTIGQIRKLAIGVFCRICVFEFQMREDICPIKSVRWQLREFIIYQLRDIVTKGKPSATPPFATSRCRSNRDCQVDCPSVGSFVD